MSNITIKDFKYPTACDFDSGRARYTVGVGNELSEFRKLMCHDCLIGIITEGLKKLSDTERNSILAEYTTVELKVAQKEETEELGQEVTGWKKSLNIMTREEIIKVAKGKGIKGNLYIMKDETLIKKLRAVE